MTKKKIHNTGIKAKKENFDAFVKLVKNQFEFGGTKYQLAEDKEITDIVCEFVPGNTGVDWVLGTCMKYLGRFKNFGNEKDILKVACYMYIIWLKMGFHLDKEHDEDIQKGEG